MSQRRRDHGPEAQDRARRADHAVEPRARNLVEILARFRVDVSQELALVAWRERIALDEPLGEPDDPELEAPSKLHRAARAPGDLDAAAPDVDDDRGVAWHAHGVGRSQVDQPRLLRARDHAGTDPRPLGDRVQERPAVLGFSGGAGRHRDDLVDPMRLGQPPELRQHLQRRVHRLGRQRAAVESTGAETHHFLLAIDDLEREVRTDSHDDHVQRVGADVDRG